MKSKLTRWAVVALAALITVIPIATFLTPSAAAHDLAFGGVAVSGTSNRLSLTDPAILIKYIGTAGQAYVDVTNIGNIDLRVGGTGAGFRDALVNTDLACGATAGVIDVSDSDCDTVGEAVDKINTSTDWLAIPVAALRTDDLNCAGAGCLADDAQTADGVAGVVAHWDNEQTLTLNIPLAPNPSDWRTWAGGIRGQQLLENPLIGRRTVLLQSVETTTYGSGTSAVAVYGITPTNKTTGSSQSVRTIWSEAGGSTTAAKVVPVATFSYGLYGNPGEYIFYRVTNSAAMTEGTAFAHGVNYLSEKK